MLVQGEHEGQSHMRERTVDKSRLLRGQSQARLGDRAETPIQCKADPDQNVVRNGWRGENAEAPPQKEDEVAHQAHASSS